MALFTLSLLDCLWHSVLNCNKNEAFFLENEGFYVVLDFVDYCHPMHRKLALSILAVLIGRPHKRTKGPSTSSTTGHPPSLPAPPLNCWSTCTRKKTKSSVSDTKTAFYRTRTTHSTPNSGKHLLSRLWATRPTRICLQVNFTRTASAAHLSSSQPSPRKGCFYSKTLREL